ncbi:hypothetical protein HK104_007237 [Borealophlyctis nickersoniae]|nr:hypothetical protein HK104_007237 [Borealophlyctis nickersoniae]
MSSLIPNLEMYVAVKSALDDEKVFGRLLHDVVEWGERVKGGRDDSGVVGAGDDEVHPGPGPLDQTLRTLLDQVAGSHSDAMKRFEKFVEEGGLREFEGNVELGLTGSFA